jgi:hypothetical protein
MPALLSEIIIYLAWSKPTIMAGLDTVDPAYACVGPVASAAHMLADPSWSRRIPRLTKRHPHADWIISRISWQMDLVRMCGGFHTRLNIWISPSGFTENVKSNPH